MHVIAVNANESTSFAVKPVLKHEASAQPLHRSGKLAVHPYQIAMLSATHSW